MNRGILCQDWRLTKVECTLYIHYMEPSLSQIPARNMGLVKHRISDPKPVPSLWVRRSLWFSKRQGEDLYIGKETVLYRRFKIYI
jgi:hypothetical protein